MAKLNSLEADRERSDRSSRFGPQVLVCLTALAAGAAGSGCAGSTPADPASSSQVEGPRSAVPPLPAAAQPAAPVAQQTPAAPPPRSGSILGQTTQEIGDAQEQEAAGAVRVQPKVTGQDPITISASAYVSIISRTEQLKIKQAIDFYYTANGRYPKDLDEFMQEIIKPNRIRLAQLPYYQKYAYDAEKHELVILEYPH